MSDTIGKKAVSGAVWASIDRFGSMALQFGVNLVLARLLLPEDFGIIGMLAIFIAVSQVLIDGGFCSALIQKKSPTQTDYSTIFYWNLVFSTLLYLCLFFCSPLVSKFFSMPILEDVLKVISLNLIVSSILAIQITRLRKELAFKKIAITNLLSSIIGSTAAIFMAYHGFGVWSLVIMQLFSGTMSVIVLWIITRWHPSVCFSKTTMKELFAFGGYIMAAGLLQEFCKNLQGIIIGKKFSATQMGYYSQAYKLDQVSSYSLPQIIVQVMYPVYSAIQDERDRLIEVLSMNIRVISFVIFPIMGLLILIADSLIVWLYGEKWLPCVPYFQILCVGGFFVCLQNINFYAIAARGKSKKLFYWSMYKWGFLLVALLTGMNFGMYGILWAMTLSGLNIYMVNAGLVSKEVGLPIFRQLSFLIPILAVTSIAFICGFLIRSVTNYFLIDIAIYLLVYFGVSFIARIKAMKETEMLLRKLLGSI